MPLPPPKPDDAVAVLERIDPDQIRAELAELARRADALRVLLRATRMRDTARRRRGEGDDAR
jgi:hypothetical protein